MILRALAILSLILAPQQQVVRRPLFPTGGGGGNNLAFVQACNANHSTATTTEAINIGATGTCSASANPVSGDLVFVYIGFSSGPGSLNCSDTLANSWTTVANAAPPEAYTWSKLTTGGSADTVTCTSGNTIFSVQFSLEFSGAAASPLDGTAQFNSIGASTSWTLPAFTTVNANDVVIGCGGNLTTNVTFTAGASFTIPTDGQVNGGGQGGFCEYQLVTATGTYTPTATVSSSVSGVGFTVAFKSS